MIGVAKTSNGYASGEYEQVIDSPLMQEGAPAYDESVGGGGEENLVYGEAATSASTGIPLYGIDPHVFVDDDGTPYLLWKSPVEIYIQQLASDGLSLVGDAVMVIDPPVWSWEGYNRAEAPWLLKHDAGGSCGGADAVAAAFAVARGSVAFGATDE